MKSGMNALTGEPITGIEYLKQRLSDVIRTPKGSLVGRRDFGSRVHEVIDHNVNGDFYMDAYIRIAEAINDKANGLDDFKLLDMTIERISNRHIAINLTGIYLDTNEPVNIDKVSLMG